MGAIVNVTGGYDRGEDFQVINFAALMRNKSRALEVVTAILASSGKATGIGINTAGGWMVFQAEIPARFHAGGWVQAVATMANVEVRELD